MTPEQKDDLAKQAQKVIEAKGWQFHKKSFLEGIAATERFHGISVPTCTTKEIRKKNNE